VKKVAEFLGSTRRGLWPSGHKGLKEKSEERSEGWFGPGEEEERSREKELLFQTG